jgi:hypothetical protein
MLKSIRVTDARLNTPIDQAAQRKVKKEKKSVQFTPQSIFVIRGRANRTALWMDEEREAKKPRTTSRPSTPADKVSEARQYKSASGWRVEDLQNCSVQVEQNVDSLKMIPPKFFNFKHEHLEQYADGSSTP